MALEGQAPTQKLDDEISIKDLILKIQNWWSFLLSKWLLIIIAGIIGGVIGLIYSSLQKPVYLASTTFVLEEEGSSNNLGNLGGIASMVGVDVGGSSGLFQGENLLEFYKSRTMIEKTLLSKVGEDNKLLIDYYLDFNDVKKNWSPELQKVDFQAKTVSIHHDRLRDSIIGGIVKDINLRYLNLSKVDEKLSIFKVNVSSENEFFAKSFNEQIVKNVNDFYVQTKTQKSLKNIGILEQKVDSVRSEINGVVYTAAAVDDQTPNMNPTRRARKTASTQLSRISTETNSAILTELLKNLELTKMTLLREAPLIQVVDEPVFPLERKNLGRTKAFVISGFLFGVLMVLFLSFKRQYSNIMNQPK